MAKSTHHIGEWVLIFNHQERQRSTGRVLAACTVDGLGTTHLIEGRGPQDRVVVDLAEVMQDKSLDVRFFPTQHKMLALLS